MKHLTIEFQTFGRFRFSEDELRVLALCAQAHYDYRCKSLALEPDEEGNPEDGLIPIMQRWHKKPHADMGYKLTSDLVDLLAKATEVWHYLEGEDVQLAYLLHDSIHNALLRMNEAYVPRIELKDKKNPSTRDIAIDCLMTARPEMRASLNKLNELITQLKTTHGPNSEKILTELYKAIDEGVV